MNDYKYSLTNLDDTMQYFENTYYIDYESESDIENSIINKVKQLIDKHKMHIQDGDNLELVIDIRIEDWNRYLVVSIYGVKKNDVNYIAISFNQEI